MSECFKHGERTSFGASELQDFLQRGLLLRDASGQISVGWGGYRLSASQPLKGPAYFITDFWLNASRPWRVPRFYAEIQPKRLLDLLQDHESSSSTAVALPDWRPPVAKPFLRVVADIKAQIAEGLIQKAVPIVFESGEARGPWLANALRAALALPRSLHVYGFWSQEEGMLGATPERLFSRPSPSEVETMALAGTYSRQEPGGAPALLADEKERAEHGFVADDLEVQLGCLGRTWRGEASILELPQLLHLYTPLKVQLSKPAGFEELVAHLHPTPALGLAPRDAGLDRLRDWCVPPGTREHFGAPFGLRRPDGRELCLVAIRNVSWQGSLLRLGAGCGIVAASQATREWEELAAKRDSVKAMLCL